MMAALFALQIFAPQSFLIGFAEDRLVQQVLDQQRIGGGRSGSLKQIFSDRRPLCLGNYLREMRDYSDFCLSKAIEAAGRQAIGGHMAPFREILQEKRLQPGPDWNLP